MIKLIASDVDGTLLPHYGDVIKPEVFELIRQLKEKGVAFCTASGRQYTNLRRVFSEVKDDIFYICENGALVVENHQTVYKGIIPDAIAGKLIEAALERTHLNLIVSGEQCLYMTEDPSFRDFMRNKVGSDVRMLPDIRIKQEDYFKISVMVDSGVGKAYEQEFKWWHDRFGSYVTVVEAGSGWIDCMPAGVNKGTTLQRIMAERGLSPENVMAFGDNYNDVEMLKAVGYGYMMANSPEPIRHATGKICTDVADVLKALL